MTENTNTNTQQFIPQANKAEVKVSVFVFVI